MLTQHFKGSPDAAQTAAIRQLRTTAAPAIAVEVSSVVVNDRAELDHMVQLRAVVHKDRKSTRLNSSHQIISYAVFCLKKKLTDPDSIGADKPVHRRMHGQ